MTWYRRSVANRREAYERIEVPSVHWEACKGANVIASGLVEADSATVFAPCVAPSVADRFDLDFKPGDILAPGIVPEEINEAFTPSALFARYPGAVRITSADFKNYGSRGMWHWQIGGR